MVLSCTCTVHVGNGRWIATCVCTRKLPGSLIRMSLSCRFYKHQYPKLEDVVMVNVRSIAEMGAYVSLLEYNNIEGMIMLSELSRRRIRSINKLVRIGRNECVVVIRVDETKGTEFHVACVCPKFVFLF